MKLYLIRHAQRGQGQDYDKLNWMGEEQAKRIGPYFKKIKLDYVYSSPQNRAIQTLESIKPFLKIKSSKIKIQDIFRQMGAPEEVGEDIIKEQKIKIDTEAELEDRTLKIIKLLKSKHKSDSVLIVSHKEVIKSLICKLFNLPPTEKLYIEKIASGSISYFELNNKFEVKKAVIGEITHLLINAPYPISDFKLTKEAGNQIVRAVVPNNMQKSGEWLNQSFKTKEIPSKSKGYKVYEIDLKLKKVLNR